MRGWLTQELHQGREEQIEREDKKWERERDLIDSERKSKKKVDLEWIWRQKGDIVSLTNKLYFQLLDNQIKWNRRKKHDALLQGTKVRYTNVANQKWIQK